MDDMIFKYNGGATLLYNWFVDNYMAESPVYSMVYIYALRLVSEGKECNNKIIADKLNIFDSDVVKAWKYWSKKNVIKFEGNIVEFLSQPASETKAIKASKDVFYNPSDVKKLSESDGNINELLKTVEQLMGRTLSPNNVSIVVNMYDKLGLSYEVIVTLVQYYSGKNLSYIEKVAISWAEKGINTIEKAEEELNSYNVYSKIIKFFGVNNRSYTEPEKKYMSIWLNDYKFSLDVIKIACERTVANTGKVSLSYANKILQNWFNKGIRTVDDIKNADNEKAGKLRNVQSNVPKNVFNNYKQRVYSDEELEEILRRKANN